MNFAVEYVSSLFGWLIEKMDAIFGAIPGAVGLILSIFAIYASSRLLLKPILGGSDRVKKMKGENDG